MLPALLGVLSADAVLNVAAVGPGHFRRSGLHVVALCVLILLIHTHVVVFCAVTTSHVILFGPQECLPTARIFLSCQFLFTEETDRAPLGSLPGDSLLVPGDTDLLTLASCHMSLKLLCSVRLHVCI